MKGFLCCVLGIGLAANGLVMLGVPSGWYAALPGVAASGPFNAHFVRDVGAAYLVAGAALLAFLRDPRAPPAALAGGAFLALHAALHAIDALAGREHLAQMLFEIPAVLLPPVLVFACSLPHPLHGATLMLQWLMRKRISAFERDFDYDMSYARTMLAADPWALLAFGRGAAFSRYRRDVPAAPYFAAKLAATMAEDCGPCTQLVVRMAEREDVPREVLRAVLARETGALPEDVTLAFRFAEATLRHSAEADPLRDEIRRRWGARGLVSLAFAVTSGRFFPTLKYALGHGAACTRVEIGGAPVDVLRRAA